MAIHESEKKSHTTAVWLVILSSITILHFAITGLPFIDWADAVAYQTSATYIAKSGSFMPEPINYSSISPHTAHAFGSETVNYPNYGFQFALAGLSALRDNFDLSNGVLLACTATILLGLIAYSCAFALTKQQATSILLAIAVLIHRSVLETAARPLSDIGLLCLFAASTFAMMKERHLAAGLIIGLGYLYREHALMFLPFLPLLSPHTTTIPRYMKVLLAVAAGFVPATLATVAIKLAFASKVAAPGGYSVYGEWLGQWLSLDAFVKFLGHAATYAKNFGMILCIFLAGALLLWPRLPATTKRMLFVGVMLAAIPCYMWTTQSSVPVRYQIYSIYLFYMAMAVLLSRLPFPRLRIALFATLLVIGTIQRPSRAFNMEAVRALASPAASYQTYFERLRAPLEFARFVKPAGLVLCDAAPFALMTLSSPVVATLPDFETFHAGQNNALVDAVLIRRTKTEWPREQAFSDALGTTFTLANTIDDNAYEKHYLYIRATPTTNTHSEP